MSAIVDSYSESNQDNTNFLYDVGGNEIREAGQSFTGGGGVLDYAKLYIAKQGSAVGSIQCFVYAHSGTYGTSSVPTGSALSTSESVDISTLSDSLSLVTFQFPNDLTLVSGTKYCLVWLVTGTTGGTSSDKNLLYGRDVSSPTHSGNLMYYSRFDSTWNAVSNNDAIFYVYESSTGWVSPSVIENVSYVANADNIKASDDTYGSVTTSFMSGFSTDGIIDLYIPSGATNVRVNEDKAFTSLSGDDSYRSMGGSSDLWGETWTVDDINSEYFGIYYFIDRVDLNSGNFDARGFGLSIPSGSTIDGIEVRVEDFGSSNQNFIDNIQIKVYYTEGSTPTVGTKYHLPPFKRS